MITREEAIARWTWVTLNVQGGNPIEATVRFTRITGEESVHTFTFADQTTLDNEGETRYRNKAFNLEIAWSPVNRFAQEFHDDGADDYIRYIIQASRDTANIAQANVETYLNQQYPDCLYRPDRFIIRMRQYVGDEMNKPTLMPWDTKEGLRTHVQDNLFEGIDG